MDGIQDPGVMDVSSSAVDVVMQKRNAFLNSPFNHPTDNTGSMGELTAEQIEALPTIQLDSQTVALIDSLIKREIDRGDDGSDDDRLETVIYLRDGHGAQIVARMTNEGTIELHASTPEPNPKFPDQWHKVVTDNRLTVIKDADVKNADGKNTACFRVVQADYNRSENGGYYNGNTTEEMQKFMRENPYRHLTADYVKNTASARGTDETQHDIGTDEQEELLRIIQENMKTIYDKDLREGEDWDVAMLKEAENDPTQKPRNKKRNMSSRH